jgi:two-component system copper resistance phosphate regulon response regulator CusR
VRILVAEDEPGILAFVTRALRADGFTIDAAADGAKALTCLSRERYDLVVLDLLLPRVDGLSVLRHLRESQPRLPVVIVSARTDLPTKLRGFELGACDYVSKPFALDELLARIRVHLRRSRPSDGEDRILRAGALLLDLTRHQARLQDGGAPVDLTDREFRLLLYLGERAGEVVSRERLLAEVWGYHFDPRSNVVEVCVRRVRRKLGTGAPIETVRNVGYRLAA